MKTATFENTVDILVKAYLNDTLRRGQCEKCAVGNIVHAAGHPMVDWDPDMEMPEESCGNWKAVFFTSKGYQRKFYTTDIEWQNLGLRMIESTGYTVDQLALVEYTFETSYKGLDPMFNGLMAVVDVLAEIHGVDLTVKESAKLLFVKA